MKEYAWTRMLVLAAFISFTTASVQPPLGEKWTSIEGSAGAVFSLPPVRRRGWLQPVCAANALPARRLVGSRVSRQPGPERAKVEVVSWQLL